MQRIASLIKSIQPQHGIHIGSGDTEITELLCKEFNQIEESLLTIIPSYSGPANQETDANKQLKKVIEDPALNLCLEAVKIPADKVLPDFYFQQQKTDLVILQTADNFYEALVAFYFIDKMLSSEGTLIIVDPKQPAMKRLYRQIMLEFKYTSIDSKQTTSKKTLIDKALRIGFAKAPDKVKDTLNQWIHPDILSQLSAAEEINDTLILKRPKQIENKKGDVDYEAQMNMDFDALLDSLMKEKL